MGWIFFASLWTNYLHCWKHSLHKLVRLFDQQKIKKSVQPPMSELRLFLQREVRKVLYFFQNCLPWQDFRSSCFLTKSTLLPIVYLIPIKIRALLNFAPLIFAHPYFTVNLPFFHSFVVFFLLPFIFTLSYCANLLPLIFAQAKCTKIKGDFGDVSFKDVSTSPN